MTSKDPVFSAAVRGAAAPGVQEAQQLKQGGQPPVTVTALHVEAFVSLPVPACLPAAGLMDRCVCLAANH